MNETDWDDNERRPCEVCREPIKDGDEVHRCVDARGGIVLHAACGEPCRDCAAESETA